MNKNTSNQPSKTQPATKPTNTKAPTTTQNQPNKRTGGQSAEVQKPTNRSNTNSKTEKNTPQPNTKVVGGKSHQPSTGKKA